MKNLFSTLLMLFFVHALFSQTSESHNYVAIIKNGRTAINLEHLNNRTPSNQPILNFRVISSKKGTHHFLVQEIDDKKGRVNRYIPLKESDGKLYANLERKTSFVDCWLMECSTCEEVVSQSGSAWCECSVGGCAQADTSDSAEEIVQYLHK